MIYALPLIQLQAQNSYTKLQPLEIEEIHDSTTKVALGLSMTDRDSAIKVYRKHLDKLLETDEAQLKAFTYQYMGETYYMGGDYIDAIPYFKNASHHSLDSFMIAKNSLRIGNCHLNVNNMDSANIYTQAGADFLVSKKDTSSFMLMYEFLGTNAYYQNKFISSIDYYQKAIDYKDYMPAGNFKLVGIYRNLASLYSAMGDYEKAIQYIEDSKTVTENLGYPRSTAEMNKHLSTYNYSLGNYNEAINFAKKSNEYYTQKKIKTGMMITLSQIARSYSALKQYDQAEIYLNKADELEAKFDIVRYNIVYYLAKGDFNIHKRQFKEAEEYFNKAHELSLDTGQANHVLSALSGLSRIYKAKGDYKRALDIQEQYINTKDSIFTLNQSNIIFDYEGRYQKSIQEKSIAELNSMNEIQVLEIAQKKRQLIYTSLGIFALLLVAGSIFFAYSNKKKNAESLTKKNTELSKALEANKDLMKEIHHRVKNNLQVISSLLNLQGRQIDDPNAKKAMKAGQNRIKSMALIHQNLYQDENISEIGLKEYVENLAHSLFNSYSVSRNDITLLTDVDDFKLDVDTIIPIGLILNELISNSLKYAFDPGQKGQITLKLKKSKDKLTMDVIDNGKGIDRGFDIEKSKSLGFKIIRSFVAKLKGSFELINLEKGTQASVNIPYVQTPI